MGRLLVLLSLLSFNAFAAQPGNAPVVCIGAPGQQTQSVCVPLSSLSGSGVDGVFSIYSTGNTANDAYPFFKNGVAYQVTAGKTAYCFNGTISSAGTGLGFQIFSATASFANGASSVTGIVSMCGTGLGSVCTYSSPTAYTPIPFGGTYTFAASTYPGMNVASSFVYAAHMDCFEK